jgi:release factor glutamine methyltransferase
VTVGETLAAATQSLEDHRISSARLTSDVLLAHCMNVDRPFLYAHTVDALSEELHQSYRSMIARRIAGEPLQYITGVQEFYGRRFAVDTSVLIPRPETEWVIEAVLEIELESNSRIVDIGTGSGCIACTLALELPGVSVSASDISLEAVRTARRNAGELEAQVDFVCTETLGAWSGPFDVVVSNPPYVRSEDFHGLQREVRGFEPKVALTGNGDPLDLYRRLCTQTYECLVDGGALVVEIGYSMEEAIRGLFDRRWELLPTRNDLQGIPRVISARKR